MRRWNSSTAMRSGTVTIRRQGCRHRYFLRTGRAEEEIHEVRSEIDHAPAASALDVDHLQRWGFRRAYPPVEALIETEELDALFVLTPRSEHVHATRCGGRGNIASVPGCQAPAYTRTPV
jgi:hypothetical protein